MLSYYTNLQSLYPTNIQDLNLEDQKQLQQDNAKYNQKFTQDLLKTLIDYKVKNINQSELINELVKKLKLLPQPPRSALTQEQIIRAKKNLAVL